jgi:hypothetical protein
MGAHEMLNYACNHPYGKCDCSPYCAGSCSMKNGLCQKDVNPCHCYPQGHSSEPPASMTDKPSAFRSAISWLKNKANSFSVILPRQSLHVEVVPAFSRQMTSPTKEVGGPDKSPILISIANDFSRFPTGMTRQDSLHDSAEAFRCDILLPALNTGRTVKVNMDGTLGFASNWLKYAFSNLTLGEINRLEIHSFSTSLVLEIEEVISRGMVKPPPPPPPPCRGVPILR